MSTRPLTGPAGAARLRGRHAANDRRHDLPACIPPAPHRPDPKIWSSDRLTVAWLGHATVLVNLFGTWILTDPALGSRIGIHLGLGTVGPRRLIGAALRVSELPDLDLVLVSHAHMDHLDKGTLRRLPRSVPIVASAGISDLLRRFDQVTELAWTEQTSVADVRITSIPARHWGARMMTDTHRGYGGFLVESNGVRLVFTGDTAHTDVYRGLGDQAPVDLAIVPIGAYDPWIANHASPEQAWEMGRDMRAQYVLPVHHSTFRLSREPMEEPIQRFLAAAGDEAWRVAASAIGETWSLPQ